jgi:hypothetical protein
MSNHYEIEKLDRHLAFLRREISYLRQQQKPWAETKADQIEQIMVIVSNVRRDAQMTGIGGKRIDG